MDKKSYLQNLSNLIKKSGYNDEYLFLCTHYASRLLENDMPVIFDIHHLSKLIGIPVTIIYKMIFVNELYYSLVEIPKKRGGFRQLEIPSVELKYIQKWIVDNILCNMHVSEYSTGFNRGCSILKNAEKHLNKECLINIDIKDFFHSISFEKVFKVFNYYGYTKEVSFILAKLCSFNDSLPQGSPASPFLSNIICLKLDKRLSELSKRYKATYTRYADDISFSGSKYIKKIIDISEKILEEEGFCINKNKTRIQYRYNRQEVTGLVVNNEIVRINKNYKRKVWQEIYYCKKFGVSDHMRYINCDKAFYKEHLYGKAFFINMVEPKEGKKMLNELDNIAWDY